MGQPTILDIAARAGVSKSLVSLVLRNAPSVSEPKRRAVLAAAAALDYRPNAVARSLVRRRTNVLGVMLSDLHNAYFAEVFDGIAARAAERGYRTMVSTGNRDPEREAEAIESLLELRMDALILAGPMLRSARIVEASRSVPVALVSRTVSASRVDCVTNDDGAGAALAVEHLVGLGHRRIAHIDGGRGAGAQDRRQGYLASMRRHGLGREARVAHGDYTEEGGARAVAVLLGRGPCPTAIFAANDLSAIGALDALTRSGLRVPEDVSLVGYDNTSLAALGHIGLTTIDQPRNAMGRTAADLLLERLERRRSAPRLVVMPPTLVVRTTTAKPRGGPASLPTSRRKATSR
ncbi:MAG TPA: LacI family DNA-binding transcriptional regulator [Gemmatimonadales bacterium]|nr:LacI family DNA-binding transcriptional regulator [Gemmatimonadales bacterium]